MNKKNKISRILSVLLTVIILISALASCSSCKKDVDTKFTIPNRKLSGNEILEYGYYTYQLFDDSTAIIVGYSGAESNLTIPDSINGHTVVEIDNEAFSPSQTQITQVSGSARLTSVTFNPSLEKIGDFAFADCQNLSSISFGDKLWSVGFDAFSNTQWIKSQSEDFVIVGNGVLIKYQGKDSHVIIPDGIRHISAAFSGNETLTSVTMGDSVITVGTSAFSGCQYLISVEFGKNVKLIDEYAFASCYTLVSGELPDSLEQVGSSAFYDCYSINAIKLGKSVKKIDQSAFESCSSMKTIDIPVSLTVIDQYAFSNCMSLIMVFYGGTEEQFKAITFDGDSSSNFRLKDAIKIYGENSNEK